MKAIRITRSNWLNDEVAGDQGAVRVVSDEMAYGAVEIHRIAVYAPEYDPVPAEVTFVGPEAAAARLDELKATVSELTAELTPVEQIEADLADMRLPGEPVPGMKRPYGNASKADWIAWAVHNGGDAEHVAGLTKNELMSRYGERL